MKIGKKLQWSFLMLLTVALIGALVLPAQTRAAAEDSLTFALNADGESAKFRVIAPSEW